MSGNNRLLYPVSLGAQSGSQSMADTSREISALQSRADLGSVLGLAWAVFTQSLWVQFIENTAGHHAQLD